MNSLIVALIFTAFSYPSVQPYTCGVDDPCMLSGYFTQKNGYGCQPIGTTDVQCTCPPGRGAEFNKPCRLCDRTNPLENVCRNITGNLRRCLETTDFGTSYVCLCSDGGAGAVATTDTDCAIINTLTPRPPTTTTASSGVSSVCTNGGVSVNGFCDCPSGYSGSTCADRNDNNLCNNIRCKNNGICAIRNPNGPYESVCLCRYGTFGDYCELNGTLGFCSAGLCLNGGACKENVVGTTRHAYCFCPAGFNGVKCENRYFVCPGVGQYPDYTLFDQGKYFDCTIVGGTLQTQQKSCPKGLRYNANVRLCTY